MRGFAIALTFFTRIPWRVSGDISARDLSRASRFYPPVGALVGFFIGGIYAAAQLILPRLLAATLAAAGGALLTGAFHEDSLGDMVDGFGGGSTRDRKLEIMRDPRQGTFGVLAIVLALLVRIEAIAVFPVRFVIPVLIAVHALSRIGPVWLLWGVPKARADGLAATIGDVSWLEPAFASLLGLAIASACLGVTAIPVALLVGLGTVLLARLSVEQIGGVTGDVLGSAQQVGELAALLGLVAAFAHPIWTMPFVAPWWR